MVTKSWSKTSRFLISHHFLTGLYLHGISNLSPEVDDVDPFEDTEEDKEELEENEVVLEDD